MRWPPPCSSFACWVLVSDYGHRQPWLQACRKCQRQRSDCWAGSLAADPLCSHVSTCCAAVIEWRPWPPASACGQRRSTPCRPPTWECSAPCTRPRTRSQCTSTIERSMWPRCVQTQAALHASWGQCCMPVSTGHSSTPPTCSHLVAQSGAGSPQARQTAGPGYHGLLSTCAGAERA